MSPLFIIRGTGFKGLDGVLVEVSDKATGVDDYVFVYPKNQVVEPIMVQRKYLQDIPSDETYTYTFEICKNSSIDGLIDTGVFEIDDAIRDASLGTIEEFILSHLKPILKME